MIRPPTRSTRTATLLPYTQLVRSRVTRDFFAAHSVTDLMAQSDYWLEMQGRLTEPMRYDAATDHYVPVSWDDAFALIGRHLRGLKSPHEAEFYTSGRTANETAFLYSRSEEHTSELQSLMRHSSAVFCLKNTK